MRDVNYGWLVRYGHSNGASFFFICVYIHIARGLYYGSYTKPRTGLWSVGVIIYFIMMGCFGPTWNFYSDLYLMSFLPAFISPNIKSIKRIGPHNYNIIEIINCGLLGDWRGTLVKGKDYTSVRFYLEQGEKNKAYLYHMNNLIFNLGYSKSLEPQISNKMVNGKSLTFYRFNTYTYTSLMWIYDGFYYNKSGKTIKKIPSFIPDYLTPLGLAIWVMEDGSRQIKQGINIATNSFTHDEVLFLADIIKVKYQLKCSVIKAGYPNQWKLSIWKESLPNLLNIISPYIIPEMGYKLKVS
jgi:hypothetical protein